MEGGMVSLTKASSNFILATSNTSRHFGYGRDETELTTDISGSGEARGDVCSQEF